MNEFKLNDKVAIKYGGMTKRLNRFGVVTKVLKTQITVTLNEGNISHRFNIRTGHKVGQNGYFTDSIISESKAIEENTEMLPMVLRKKALYSLSVLHENITESNTTLGQLHRAIKILRGES